MAAIAQQEGPIPGETQQIEDDEYWEEEEEDDILDDEFKAHIDWNHLDKRKFFFFSTLFFLGVRGLVYPASLIKTRIQMGKVDGKYRKTLQTAGLILREEGFRGLYRGFAIVSVAAIPAQNAYLTAYEFVKQRSMNISAGRPVPPFVHDFLAGGSASLMSQLIVCPIDVVSQRLMMQDGTKQNSRYKGGAHALREIMRTEGVRGLYRGLHMALIAYVPSSSVWWGSYGVYKNFFIRNGTVQDAEYIPYESQVIFYQAISGACAGTTSAILTCPLDVVKTRIQTSPTKMKIREAVSQILEEFGVFGLWRGLQPRILNMAPVSLLMISTYELVKRLSMKDQS
eukprot:Clim_evm158s147 gene=Clim_evmTU158s147